MSEAVTAIPTFGFARGAIVRRASGGPNMLVVRDLGDAVCVVRCEGDEAGTLRLREEQKDGLVQVLDHRAAEITSLRSQLDEARRKAIEECAAVVDAVRVEFVAAGAAIVESGVAQEIMPEAVVCNLSRIAKSIRALLSESKT